MTPVYAEIHRWLGVPFVWGETDCMLVLADWVHKVRGVDPARDLRGTYDSRGSCQRETNFFRDPVGCAARCFEGVAGLARVDEPQPGDVALLRLHAAGRMEVVGGIWLGTAWGCKSPEGVTTLSAKAVPEVLAIWGVGHAG